MIATINDKINTITSELDYQVSLVQHRKNLPVLSNEDQLIAQTLNKEGVYITSLESLGLPSTAQMLESAKNYAAMMKNPRNIESGYNLPQIYTVTDLPEFVTWGIEERLQNIIEHYIRLPIAFHGVHVRKDFPNEQQLQTLLWHKDSEDRRMMKVIIYLHDVTEKHGAFEYIPLPTNPLELLNYYRVDYALWKSNFLGINDQKMMNIIPKKAWKYCPGKAGTIIFVDPRNVLHHGTVRSEERSTIFFVYTAKSPKRPELCTQYNDDTFIKPNKQLMANG
ncbi:phytanoyl-CoA dioxygenase [Sphaerospermopsis aphanizomenoides BCCUSP55]|uniref:phytanoyl-CoA dioxygenase n=1 Tax=Sphaerospermopsis aphanizomenoides TaxID=459663 RepID=UPI001904E09A|nr:phytanoyl-CoA dioxygenase [Sphaerospermopsis aphanizomenoides]MBK1986695.1 phytanoyl-CoA dioxygenase [Sphaerospermopsis aphanizomenoides BCCUSP55]